MPHATYESSPVAEEPSDPLSRTLKDCIRGETVSPPLSPMTRSLESAYLKPGIKSELSGESKSSHSPERRRTKTPTTLPRRREEGHVRRPANPFILFACKIRAQNKGADNRKLSKIAGDAWKALSDTEKKVWRDLADRVKEKHAVDHPDYQYKPRRRDSAQSPSPKKSRSMKKSSGDSESVFPPPEHDVFPSMKIAKDEPQMGSLSDGREDMDDVDFGGLIYPPDPCVVPGYEELTVDPLTPPTSATMDYFPLSNCNNSNTHRVRLPQYHWNSNYSQFATPKPFTPDFFSQDIYQLPVHQTMDFPASFTCNEKFALQGLDPFATHYLPPPPAQLDIPFSYMNYLPNQHR